MLTQTLLLIVFVGIVILTFIFKEKVFPIIPILSLAIFLGLIVGILTTPTDHISLENPYVQTTTALSFAVMLLLHIKNTLLSKCQICSKRGIDNLTVKGKNKKLCRKHLLSEYIKAFLSFNPYLVVIHPNCAFVKSPHLFLGFSPIEKLKAINMDKVLGKIASESLLLIKGKCIKCEKSATVVFYNSDSYKYSNDGYPLLEEISTKPKIYCKECTAEILLNSMSDYNNKFTNPVVAPYGNDPGIVFPWIV